MLIIGIGIIIYHYGRCLQLEFGNLSHGHKSWAIGPAQAAFRPVERHLPTRTAGSSFRLREERSRLMDSRPTLQRSQRITARLTSCIAIAAGLVACQTATTVDAPAPPPPPAVHVAKATQSDGTGALRLSGALEADRNTTLSFAVVGTVEQVFVKEGQAVKRGQVIARISPLSYQDMLNIAKSKAAQAEDAQRRLKPMYDNKTLPEVKMVEVDTSVEQARLAVSMAAKNVADTVLRAPTDGIVARRNLEPGSSVGPGVPVVSLVQTKTIVASAPLPETRVAKVKPGDSARVFVSALGKWFDGTVRDIGLIADPLTRTYATRVAIPNQGGAMRIGMVAEIDLVQTDGTRAIVVPPEAIRLDAEGAPFLFVLKQDNKLERRPVKVAGYVGEGSAISEGIADGESVITSGTSMLEEGMTVRVVERKGGAQ